MDIFQVFGLAANPFSTTPDPTFAFETREHKLALLKISYSVEQQMGLFLLQGEVGTGKTTLCRFLQQSLADDGRYVVAYLANMNMRTPAQFLRAINTAYGMPPLRQIADLDNQLLGFLVEKYKEGKTVVLMIDEAQTIHGTNLTTLHMLSNHQTTKHKLLQMVLFAQPTFIRKIDHVPALKSRITAAAYLNPLPFPDAMDMLRYRVRRAGGETTFDDIFPGEELHHSVYQAAGGKPRDLCVLCNAAMVNAVGLGYSCVKPDALQAAIRDFKFKFQGDANG